MTVYNRILLVAFLCCAVHVPIQAGDNPLFEQKVSLSAEMGFGSLTMGGFSVAMDQPLWQLVNDIGFKYFSFGPRLDLLFGSDMVYADIDAFFKARLPVVVPRGFFSFYLDIPAGLTVHGYSQRAAVGLNAGIFPGAEYFITRNIGMSADLGFMYHGVAKSGRFENLLNGMFKLGLIYAF